MRRAFLLVVPLVTLLLAGCAEQGGLGFAGSPDARDPYFEERHDVIAGSYSKLYDVPVDVEATLLNVTFQLDARTNGLPVPETAPAQLTLRLLDPIGALVQDAAIDMQHPIASLTLEGAAPGLYHVDVKGFGAAQELDGQTYGAGYVVTIEITY